MTKKAILIAFSLMLSPLSGLAQNFDAGGAAFNNGDYITALHEWVPLAEEGNADAQNNLGVMHEEGLGVVQDYAEAVRWHQLAADQGNVYAQSNLGFMYRNGLGVVQDYAEAVRWYQLAADQGNANAQSNLGFMYATGYGVTEDYETAHMWFNIAASNGLEKARASLEEIAGMMLPHSIAEAQKRARRCRDSHYQVCD